MCSGGIRIILMDDLFWARAWEMAWVEAVNVSMMVPLISTRILFLRVDRHLGILAAGVEGLHDLRRILSVSLS